GSATVPKILPKTCCAKTLDATNVVPAKAISSNLKANPHRDWNMVSPFSLVDSPGRLVVKQFIISPIRVEGASASSLPTPPRPTAALQIYASNLPQPNWSSENRVLILCR